MRGTNAQYFRLGYVANPLPGHEQYRGKIAIPYITRTGIVQMRFRQVPRRNPLYVAPDVEVPEAVEYVPEGMDGDIPPWEIDVPEDFEGFEDPEMDPDGFEYEEPLFGSNEEPEESTRLSESVPGVLPTNEQWLPIEGAKYLSVAGELPRPFNPLDLDRPESFICVCEGEMDAMTAHQDGLPAIGIAGVNQWRTEFEAFLVGYKFVYILADNDDKGQGKKFAETIAAAIPNARIVSLPKGHDVNSHYIANGEGSVRALIKEGS